MPSDRTHNGHMYYLLLPDLETRTRFIDELGARGILAVFHYVPLHSSPTGARLGRAHGDLAYTRELSDRLVRIPLWTGMSDAVVARVIESVRAVVGSARVLSSQAAPAPEADDVVDQPPRRQVKVT